MATMRKSTKGKPADPLAPYNAKRDFAKTAEPRGERGASADRHRFVVQKHAARRLHWDFRLEVDGVLKSWAITRGPSADPDDKRLAVRTEDHPLSYARFEGNIPAGEYGGGTVMLWDEGTWAPVAGKSAEDIDNGHLHFTLAGRRMKGEWLLVRMKGRPGETRENWLLRKVADAAARHGDGLVEDGLSSVLTGRTMDAIASDAAATQPLAGKHGQAFGKAMDDAAAHNADVKAAPPSRRSARTRAQPPAFRAVQLATLVDAVPTGNSWMHEVKFDGYRALVAAAGQDVRVYTRNGHDWSDKFAPLAERIAALGLPPCLIDGEIIARDTAGNPDFSALQAVLKRGHGAQTPQDALEFHAFDLLALDGEDLAPLPQIERKERLEALLGNAPPPVFVAQHVIGAGEKLFAAMCGAGQEGIIAKRIDAPYRGTRSSSWVKIKCIRRQEFVIVGYAPSKAKGRPFASLLLGQYEGKALVYRGRVGTGFGSDRLADLADRLAPLATGTAPLEVPAPERRGAHWVKPELVAEIAFAELTADNRVRHASFIGLRADKPASDVRPERPAKAPAATPGPVITHGSRVIFPDTGGTKQDLADYVATVAPLLLPFAANRPLSLVRCPGGRAKACFFQKHDSGAFGPDVHHVSIAEQDGGHEDYLYVRDAAGLLACVQMGAIEFHAWECSAQAVERPDRLIFDLDPDADVAFQDCVGAAIDIRDELAGMGLRSFALLSGGKGVHVTVPLTPGHDWDTHKDFARRFATALATAHPDRFVATMSKAKRKGKIFIDWLRNQRGSTAVVPYSPRARDGAPVAVPIAWDELREMTNAHPFTIRDGATLIERARDLAGWGFAAQRLPEV